MTIANQRPSRHRPKAITAGLRSLEELPTDAAKEWRDKLTELDNECGCRMGAKAFLFAAALCPIIWISILAPRIQNIWILCIFTALLLIISVCIGKAIGLLVAKKELKKQLLLLDEDLVRYSMGASNGQM